MKKFTCILCSIAILPHIAQAEGFDFSQSGLAGVYYGVMQTRRQNNYDNMPNRVVYRQDGRFEGAYKFADETRLGAHADYTLAFRQHDKIIMTEIGVFIRMRWLKIRIMVNLQSVIHITLRSSCIKAHRISAG